MVMSMIIDHIIHMIIDYLFLIDFSAAVFGKGGVTGKNLVNKNTCQLTHYQF